MSNFTVRVYRVVSKIPSGKVASYTQVARLAGSPKAVRAVGTILRKNTQTAHAESDNIIPCHRVVRANGVLGQYNGGISKKRALLRKEGVLMHGDIVNSKYFWKK